MGYSIDICRLCPFYVRPRYLDRFAGTKHGTYMIRSLGLQKFIYFRGPVIEAGCSDRSRAIRRIRHCGFSTAASTGPMQRIGGEAATARATETEGRNRPARRHVIRETTGCALVIS